MHGIDFRSPYIPVPLAALHAQETITGHEILSVFIDIGHEHIKLAASNSDEWAHLNTIIDLLQLRLLLGFNDRESMLSFAAAVVNARLPSVSTRGEVKYSIARRECREGRAYPAKYWYQASLGSEGLQGVSAVQLPFQVRADKCTTGDGTEDVWKVYP